MDFKDRKKAQDAILRQHNQGLRQQLTGRGGVDYNPPLREYGPRMTKKEWEQVKSDLTNLKRETQRALWYAQQLDESEEQKSLEDSIGWVKQFIETIMGRMRV